MERVLTIEDFREWGRIGGKKRVKLAGPEKVRKQAIKANIASVKSRQAASKQKQAPFTPSNKSNLSDPSV